MVVVVAQFPKPGPTWTGGVKPREGRGRVLHVQPAGFTPRCSHDGKSKIRSTHEKQRKTAKKPDPTDTQGSEEPLRKPAFTGLLASNPRRWVLHVQPAGFNPRRA